MRSGLTWFGLALTGALAINLAAVAISGGYDLNLGPLHVGAHSTFKALQELEGGFLVVLAARGLRLRTAPETNIRAPGNLWSLFFVVILTLAIYLPSLPINFTDHDWTHRHISADIHSFGNLLSQFTMPKADGFYRPLTFVSLWIDFRAFGEHWWGYHLQSIALHIANAFLVGVLALRLQFSDFTARGAALLFAAAAVNFEPVLWPAARFDLLAALFTLLAWIAAIDYLSAAKPSWFQAAKPALLLVVALMNKESAYCFPLVLLCLAWARWDVLPFARQRLPTLLAITGVAIAGMLLVRLAVYHGIGGYPPLPGAASPQFHFGWKTITSLVTRIPLPLLGVNTAMPLAAWAKAIVVAFGGLLVWMVRAGARASRDGMLLLLCALASAVPTLNIIDWVGGSMQHSRYLYLPAVWIVVFLAAAVEKLPGRATLVALMVLLNTLGATWNLHVYRTMLERAAYAGSQVAQDGNSSGKIVLAGVPPEPYGVFFFGSEVVERIRQRLPHSNVETVEESDAANCDPQYHWDPAKMVLVKQAAAAGCSAYDR